MPQIEEVQFVHWGSLRPDPVPLLVSGINVATGPNGSGKTCFLDGLKLLLGVTDFTAGRTPAKYIFDGGSDGAGADRAYLRATFANPVSADRRHRVFAYAGHGCEAADRVTVVCVVTGQERWYVALPGRVRWGVTGRSLAADLAEIDGLARSRRLGPRQYDTLLDRTGVTKALRGVLALPQGATDRLVEERPQGLLRRLLELTGKQATLDEFRAQRDRYEQVSAAYQQTKRRHQSEQTQLALLEEKARRHEEWVGLCDEAAHLAEVLLPAVGYRDLLAEEHDAKAEHDRRAKAVTDDEAALADLERELPRLVEREGALASEAEVLRSERDRLDVELRGLDQRIGALERDVEGVTAERDRVCALVAGRSLVDAEAAALDAEERYGQATSRRDALRAQLQDLEHEIALLRAGRPVPPGGLEAFRDRLAVEGISGVIVAETLDVPDGASDDARILAEAALGDALWAVVVPAERYRHAVSLAVDEGYRWPVVAAGPGEPGAALAGLEAPDGLGALLAHLDARIASDAVKAYDVVDVHGAAVAPDGVRYGAVLSRLQVRARPVLGRRARARRLAEAERTAGQVGAEVAVVEAELPSLRAAWQQSEAVVEGVRRLPELHHAAEEATRLLAETRQCRDPLEQRRNALHVQVGQLERELGASTKEREQAEHDHSWLKPRLAERRKMLEMAGRKLETVTAALARIQLTEEQAAALGDDLAPSEALRHQHERLSRDTDDLDRFPADVRDDVILAQRDDQARAVKDVAVLLTGRQEDLDEQQRLVDEARRRYDDHVRAVVRLLNEEFARICVAAGAEGEIRLAPGNGPDDLGVEVRVAHRKGEPRRSYRDVSHSGGQRAKIAILVLLAAMGVGGAADLLVMDEHIAHLDSTNIDHIAELMRALRDRVQFVLATPTNAESLRLVWCDLQLAFLPRVPGEAYTPPIRVMSRLGAEDLEARFADAQLALS